MKKNKVVAFWKNNTHPITGFVNQKEQDPYILRMNDKLNKKRKDEAKLRG